MADNSTYTLKDLTNSKSLKLAGAKLTQIDPKVITAAGEISYDAISITQNSAVDELLGASAKTDASEAPQTPSYQPLNEAAVASSGSYTENSALGTMANTTDAFLAKSLESINKAGVLDPDFYQKAKFSGECIQDTNGVFAEMAANLANSSEKGSGKIIFNATSDLKISGNQMFFASEGVISETTPAKISNSDVAVNKARSSTNIFDSQQSFGKIQSNIIQATSFIGEQVSTIASQTINNFTTTTKTAATELAQLSTNISETFAGAKFQISSKAEGVITAVDNLTNLAGNVNIIASPGTIASGNPTKAEGSPTYVDPTTGEVKLVSGSSSEAVTGDESTAPGGEEQTIGKAIGALNIIAQGQKPGEGVMQVFSQQHLNSSQEGTYTLSKGTVQTLSNDSIQSSAPNLTQLGTEGAQFGTLAGAPLLISNGKAALSLIGKLTKIQRTIGRLRTAINPRSYEIPGVNQVPGQPPFPEPLSKEQLSSCIPEEFKPKPKDVDAENPEGDIRQGTKPSEAVKPTQQKRENQRVKGGGKFPGSTLPSPSGTTDNLPNEKDYEPLRDALKKAKEARGSGEGEKLGPITRPISTTGSVANGAAPPLQPPNTVVSGNAACKSGIDIFCEPYNAVDPLAGTTPGDLEGEGGVQDEVRILSPTIIKEAGEELTLDNTTVTEFLKPENITLINKLNFLPREELDILSNLENLIDLLPNEDSKIIKQIQNLLELPDALVLLKTSLDTMNTIAGIGGLFGSIGGLFKGLSSKLSTGITLATNLSSANGSPLSIYKALSSIPGVSNLTQKITGAILPKSGFIADLGKAILTGVTGGGNIGETLETAAKGKLQDIAKSAITKLGGKYGTAAGSIYDILQDQQSGKPVNREELIGKIAGVLGDVTGIDEINKSVDIYKDLEPIIKDISKGDFNSVLKEGVLEGVAGSIFGAKAVGTISDLRDIYGKGKSLYNTIKAVPTLLNLMKSYQVPTLNQVAILLGCLDIIDQILGIFESVKDLVDEDGNKKKTPDELTEEEKENKIEDILRTVENLPRLTQVFNTIKELPIEEVINSGSLNSGTTPLITDTVGTGGVTGGTDTFPGGGELPNPNTPPKPSTTPTITNSRVVSPTSEVVVNLTNPTVPVIPPTTPLPRPITPPVTPGIIDPFNPIRPRLPISPTLPSGVIPPITIDEIIDIKTLSIDLESDNCYVLPRLNFLEASIQIVELFEGQLTFRLPYYQLLQFNDKNIYPSRGDLVHIRVSGFRRDKDNAYLSILEGEDYFTPAVYSFVINDFNTESNFGLASIVPNFPYVYLVYGGVTYQYSVADIGKRIYPIIEDAYLVL